jgi:hypothetical protein
MDELEVYRAYAKELSNALGVADRAVACVAKLAAIQGCTPSELMQEIEAGALEELHTTHLGS